MSESRDARSREAVWCKNGIEPLGLPMSCPSGRLASLLNVHWLGEELLTSGQPDADELCAVAAAGYEVVINLGLPDAEYALAGEQVLSESLGLVYIGIPVPWQAPTHAHLLRFVEVMRETEGRRRFVHCAANKRAPVFVALYRILALGWPEPRALADLAQSWDPDECWSRFVTAELAAKRH
ncbi:MAG: protein tyrosine phosphatase family protein [Acidiferrobacteraceae bacterium]